MTKTSLFVLALVTSAAALSQNTTPQMKTAEIGTGTRFGLRGGANVADLTSKNVPSTSTFTEAETKTSFNGGFFVNMPLTGMFRFQPEISYSSQGGKLK